MKLFLFVALAIAFVTVVLAGPTDKDKRDFLKSEKRITDYFKALVRGKRQSFDDSEPEDYAFIEREDGED